MKIIDIVNNKIGAYYDIKGKWPLALVVNTKTYHDLVKELEDNCTIRSETLSGNQVLYFNGVLILEKTDLICIKGEVEWEKET